MSTNYILISELTPLKYEYAEHLFEPERKKSNFVITVSVTTISKQGNNKLNMFTHYTFNITDNKNIVCGLSINHLNLEKIQFDFEKNVIEFYLHYEEKIYNHKIKIFRKNTDIRIDIIGAIKYLFGVSPSDDLLKITEIKTSP